MPQGVSFFVELADDHVDVLSSLVSVISPMWKKSLISCSLSSYHVVVILRRHPNFQLRDPHKLGVFVDSVHKLASIIGAGVGLILDNTFVGGLLIAQLPRVGIQEKSFIGEVCRWIL
jgi:hypothetical protein